MIDSSYIATHRIITKPSVQYNKTNLVKLYKNVMSIPDYMDIFLINSSFKKVYGNTFLERNNGKEMFRYFETSVQLRYEKKNNA